MNSARRELEQRLTDSASPKVKGLFASWKEATAAAEASEKQLQELGYRLDKYPNAHLAVHYTNLPQELIAFDEETTRTAKRITNLKGEYTLRLYAGGEEARALFSTLAAELANIMQ